VSINRELAEGVVVVELVRKEFGEFLGHAPQSIKYRLGWSLGPGPN